MSKDKLPIRQLLSGVIYLLLSVTAAVAQQVFTVPVDATAPTELTGVDSGDRVVPQVTPFESRSYCCSITSTVADAGVRFSQITNARGSNFGPADDGRTEPWVAHVGSHSAPEESRGCFSTFSSMLSIGFAFIVGVDTGPVSTASVECRETTLFGGYNTSVNELNFLEITNVTEADQSIDVTFTDSVQGNQAGGIRQLVIPANARVDISVHDNVPPQVFGGIILTHSGPPGALRADVSQYKITSSSPLAFEQVVTTPLKTRSELAGR